MPSRKSAAAVAEAAALAAASAPPSDLTRLHELADEVDVIKADIEMIETVLKAEKSRLHAILTQEMPEVMSEAGFARKEKVEAGGWSFVLGENIRGTWPKPGDAEKIAAAKAVLKQYEAEGLLRTTITAVFPAGESEAANEAATALIPFCDPVVEENVHHSSLWAFARELIDKEVDVPFVDLNLYHEPVVKIRKLK